MDSGKLLVHIRVQNQGYFTIYQSESVDGGHTFSKPRQLLGIRGGAPAHLIQDGKMIISTYGYRELPYGIRVMFSCDEGENWETDQIILDDCPNNDLGYPSSVLLEDKSILTVFYKGDPVQNGSKIMQVNWRYQF